MLLQEEQPSDFSSVHVEFSRFSSGLKLNSSPRCHDPIKWNHASKININFEICSILS